MSDATNPGPAKSEIIVDFDEDLDMFDEDDTEDTDPLDNTGPVGDPPPLSTEPGPGGAAFDESRVESAFAETVTDTSFDEDDSPAGLPLPVDEPATGKFTLLPAFGDGAPVIDSQARIDNVDDTSLVDLISSIGSHGLLHPIHAETMEDGQLRLVIGERRFRACRWLTENVPDNPHIADGIPAFVYDAPLSETQRRERQWNENFARQGLSVHETGAALVWERCALLTVRLTAAGHEIPPEILSEDDPVKRWAALEEHRIKSGASRIGAPWAQVIEALGVQMTADRATQLARAFQMLPEGVGAEMDAAQISLHSRLKWLKLRTKNTARADEVWETVRDTDPALLPSVVDIALDEETSPTPAASESGDPAPGPRPVQDIIEEADELRDEANEARSAGMSQTWLDDADTVDSAIASGNVVITQNVAKYAKPAADKMARLVKELEKDDVVIEASQAERLQQLCVVVLDVIEDQKRPQSRPEAF